MDEVQMDKDTMWVVTSEPMVTRGGGKQAKPLKVEWLAENVNLFIGQMGALLENTPEKVGRFQFEELEVHAVGIAQAADEAVVFLHLHEAGVVAVGLGLAGHWGDFNLRLAEKAFKRGDR